MKAAPPWHDPAVLGPLPDTPYAVFDGARWRPAHTQAELDGLVQRERRCRPGPFKVPGQEGLADRWHLPGAPTPQAVAIEQAEANVDAAARRLVVLALAAMLLGQSLVLLVALVFGLVPLAQAWAARHWARSQEFTPLDRVVDVQFDVWLSRQRAWACWAVAGALLVAYGLTIARSGGWAHWFAPSPEALQGLDKGPAILRGEWWRLFTCLALHGNAVHLALNLAALLQLGKVVESLLGPWRLLGVLLACGLAGSALSLALAPERSSVGASGAVCGLLGVLVAFRWTGQAPSHVAQSMVALVVGLVALGVVVPVVDNAAHAGGLGAGMAIGLLALGRRWPAPEPNPPPLSLPPAP